MDSLKESYEKAAGFARGLPASGRWALLTVPAVLAVGFAGLLWGGPGGDETPVSWGKVFATDELRAAEQALIEAGLTDFRTSGQRIFAPAGEVDAYNAALMVDGRLPGDSLSEFERQFDKAGLFTSREQLAGLRDIALRKEVRKTLAAVPDIDSADVLWSVKQTGEWPRRSKKTAATVSLMPRRGTVLESARVASIRRAVANMVPDLAEEDVTVFDQSTGTAHAHAPGGPLDDRTQAALASHTERYRGTIREALAYIPGARVNVSVDLDAVRRQVERSQTVDSKQTVTLQADETTRSRTATRRQPRGEPGVASNTPASVAEAPGPAEQTTDESTGSKTRVVPSWTTVEKELREAMPTAVRVAVSIPDDYHAAVAAGRGVVRPNGAEGEDEAAGQAYRDAVEAIRVAEEEKVREHVRTLLPEGSPETAIHVATVTPITPDVPVVAVPWTHTLQELLNEWGSTALLAALAVAGLVVLRRGMAAPAEPPAEDGEGDAPMIAGTVPAEEVDPATLPPRDRVAALARDDPEAVAAVVNTWLRDAA